MPDDSSYDPATTPEGESPDPEDEGVLDASDTLEGDPGDDPLDQGIIPPDRWSAGQRYGTTEEEQRAGESLDQLLAEEEPDQDPYADDEPPEEASRDARFGAGTDGTDENAGDEDVDGLLLDDGPDPRSGRLVAEDEGAHPDEEPDLVARDVGIDAGAASAEEAAVHVVTDDDTDIRSGD
jgi:Family of unknown function (DUF5709)